MANSAKEMPTNSVPSVGSFYPPPQAQASTVSANAKPANKPANAKPANAKPANAKPAPEIVKVIKAANAAVNGNAKKVAALLENEHVVKAAENLVKKLTPNDSPRGRFVDQSTKESRGTMVGGRKTRKSKGKRKSRSSRR
jgi:hypothetical protein